MHRARRLFVAAATSLGLLASCALGACSGGESHAGASDAGTSSSASASCTAVDASACKMPVPSYKTDIAPALDHACNSTCHAPGVGPWPLVGYQNVADWKPNIFVDLENCTMPPAHVATESPPLTAADRERILDWIACGAPNN